MRQLVIEYVFEGHERGYQYTAPTHGYSDSTLKLIWRTAMPRGQGWGAPEYAGAQSFKCFPLGDGRVALSDVTTTPLRDEGGRGGIRRAEITVVSERTLDGALNARLSQLPQRMQAQVHEMLGFWSRGRITGKIPAPGSKAQAILARPYTGAQDWQMIEALLLTLATTHVRRLGRQVAFTTLALTHREESPVVGLPQDKARQAKDVPIITID